MRIAVVLLCLAPLLGGCGVPDLVAHTVKAVEKNQRDGAPVASGTQTQASSQPTSPQTRDEEPPPPVAQPQPHRSSVTVEELPAR